MDSVAISMAMDVWLIPMDVSLRRSVSKTDDALPLMWQRQHADGDAVTLSTTLE